MAKLSSKTALPAVVHAYIMHIANSTVASYKVTILQLKNSFEELKTSFLNGGIANPLATQAGANQYTKARVKIDTCVTDGDSVKTMTATAGAKQYFYNNTLKDVYVFPVLGDNFLGMAANAPQVVVSGQSLNIFCFSTGEWTLV